MEHHAVDAVAEQVRHRLVQTQARQDGPHRLMVAVRIGFRAAAGVASDRNLRPCAGLIQDRAQGSGALAPDGNRRHHRHAKLGRQRGGVHPQSAPLRHIGHVQRHHARQFQALYRQNQAQVAAQIGGVDDAHHQIRPLLAGRLAGQHIAGHPLVGRARMQTVSTRQIEHPHHLAGAVEQASFLAFDRHPGIVGNLLPAAGQQVEQRGLATVRIADQRHQRAARLEMQDRLTHGQSCTSTHAASARRRAKVDAPIRTTSGSPPGTPRASTVTGSPGTKPISSSHSCHCGCASGTWTATTRMGWRRSSASSVRCDESLTSVSM
jgi:hypothetical protein